MGKHNLVISELVWVAVLFDYLIKAMILLSGRLHTYIVQPVSRCLCISGCRKYCFITCYRPSTVPGTWETSVNKIDKDSYPVRSYMSDRKHIINKYNKVYNVRKG